jgi:hypothetical protein
VKIPLLPVTFKAKENIMADKPDELRKLIDVATDMVLPAKVRADTIKYIGNIGTREALLALLELAANEALTKNEREQAVKLAREIIRAGH